MTTETWCEKTAWFLCGLLFGLTGYKTRKLRDLERRTGKRLTLRGWKEVQ